MGGEFTRCALQQFLKDIPQTKDTPFPPGVCVYICIDLWVVLLKLTLKAMLKPPLLLQHCEDGSVSPPLGCQVFFLQ